MSTSSPDQDVAPYDDLPPTNRAVIAEPQENPGPRRADLHEEPPGAAPRDGGRVAPAASPGPNPEDVDQAYAPVVAMRSRTRS